jgi:hypothetical protein
VTATITNSTIDSNNSEAVGGGGVENQGAVEITNSAITNNVAGGDGGGIRNAGSMTITQGTIVQNVVSSGHGGGVWSSGTATITLSTIDTNAVDFGNGGGVLNSGTVTIAQSSIAGNTVSSNGGGVWNSGAATITQSTINGNTASFRGGGIWSSGMGPSALTLINSTISANVATNDAGGVDSSGSAVLNNVTVAMNVSNGVGGYRQSGGTTSLGNSIIAANGGSPQNCSGVLTSLGYNLIVTDVCDVVGTLTGNIVGDPNLGPLADNGGPTLTHALLAGSVAINAGNPGPPGPGGAACEAVDQRGLSRGPSRCDIGAFESSFAAPPAVFPVNVDATELSLPFFAIQFGPDVRPTSIVQSFSLFPGFYGFFFNGMLTSMAFSWSVGTDGLVGFDPILDGFLAGRGTTTLTVHGYEVQIDGTALGPGTISLTSLLLPTGIPDLDQTQVHSLRLVPGTYEYSLVGTATRFAWTLRIDGTIDVNPALEPCLSGRGTSRLTVSCGLSAISGRVTGGASPFFLANVTAHPEAPTGIFGSATTGPTGDYSITGLPAGLYRVQVQSFGFQTEWFDHRPSYEMADLVSVPLSGTATGVDFALSAGAGGISGTVRDQSGNPVPFAQVVINLLDDGFVMGVSADSTGTYNTGPNLAAGTYVVQAGPQFGEGGFGTVFFVAGPAPEVVDFRSSTPVTVLAGAITGGVDFVLPPGGAISGRVTNAGGQPISSAVISIFDFASGTFITTAMTDADGNFFTGFVLAPGTYRVQVEAGGFLIESTGAIAVAGGQTTPGADVALDASGAIAGRVTQADGVTPIAGARVEAGRDDGNGFGSALTDASGNYVIGGLPPGSYRVQALANDFATRYFDGSLVRFSSNLVLVNAGATTAGIDFALPAGAGSLSGRVTRADGVTPIPFALVQIDLVNGGCCVMFVNADALGNYTSGPYLGPDIYRVLAVPDAFVRTWFNNRFTQSAADPVTVIAGADTAGVDFALQDGGGIAGQVTCHVAAPPICPSAGAPIAGAVIDVLEPTGAFVIGGFGTMITGPDGRYSTGRVLRPGSSFVIRVRLPGTRLIETFHARAVDFAGDFATLGVDFTTASAIPIVAGQDAVGRDIAVPMGGEITGVIRDRVTGLPIAGVSVFVSRFEASNFFGTFSAQTDANGFYAFRGLLDGDWTVEAHAPGYVHGFWSGDPSNPAPDGGILAVIRISGANAVSGVGLSLTAGGGAVQGRVLRSDNNLPVPAGTTVQVRGLFPRSSGVASTTTDASGNYSILGLGTGQYTIEVRGRQFAGGTAIGWFPAGATARGTALPVSVTDGQTTIVPDFMVPGFGAGQSPRTISGTLRDAGGNRLAFAAAVAIDLDTGSTVRFVTTNGDGTYTINTLPAKAFIVVAETETTFERRFFGPLPGGEPFFDAAQPVDVTAADASGIDVSLPATAGTVSGRITRRDTGQPVPGASIQLRNGLNSFVAGATAQQDGTFLVRGVPPGTYRLRASGEGLVPGFFTTSPTAALTFDDGSFIVVVSGQDTGGTNVALDPGAGAITGTVRDAVTLEPVVGTGVGAYGLRFLIGADTRADGTYRINGIGSGGYLIQGSALGRATRWFNGRESRATADPVTVTGPGVTSGIDFLLSPSQGSLSGRVFRSDGETPIAGASVLVFDAADGGFITSGGPTDALGRYAVRGLAPAGNRYIVQARALGRAREYFDEVVTLSAATRVSVADGADTPSVNFRLSLTSNVTGLVSYAGTRAGALRVGLFADAALTQSLYSVALPSPVYPQAFGFASPPPDTQGVVPGSYFVAAFIDTNGNGTRDASETASAAVGPVVVAEGATGVANLALVDPDGAPPPVITPIGNRDVNETGALSFTVGATGGSGSFSFAAFSLPRGASFDPATGEFTWTPASDQSGDYHVCFTVSDGETSDVQCVTLTVNDTVADADSDGVPDSVDNCPFRANPGQEDSDGDGVGDACDNCPGNANPDQLDDNLNGRGDVCELQIQADIGPRTPATILFGEAAPVEFRVVASNTEAGPVKFFPPSVCDLTITVIDVTGGGRVAVPQERIWECGLVSDTDAVEVPAGTSQTHSAVIDLTHFFPLQPGRTYEVSAVYHNFYTDDGVTPFLMGFQETSTHQLAVAGQPGQPPAQALAAKTVLRPAVLGITGSPIPTVLHAFIGNIPGMPVSKIDRDSVRLNNTLAPRACQSQSSFTGFTGPVLKCEFDMAGAIASLRELVGHALVVGAEESMLLTGRLKNGATVAALFSDTPTVRLDLGAVDLLIDFLEILKGMGLPPAHEARLRQLLETALANRRSTPLTCATLNTFVQVVQSLRGRGIPVAKADALVVQARRITAVLGCA